MGEYQNQNLAPMRGTTFSEFDKSAQKGAIRTNLKWSQSLAAKLWGCEYKLPEQKKETKSSENINQLSKQQLPSEHDTGSTEEGTINI